MTTTLLPGLLRTVARNVSRGTSDLALFETAPVTLPHSGVGAPILPGRPAADRGGVGRPEQGAARPAAAPRLRALCGDRDRAGWWGDGPAGRLERRHRDRPRGGRRPRARADRPARQPGAVAPGTLCRAASSARPSVGHAGELHPKVCRAFGVPARTVGRRARPRRPARARRHRADARPTSRPTRSPRRTSPSSSPTTCRPRSWPRRCAKGPGRCASRCGSSTSTPASRSARAASRWRSRCASGRPTAP